MRRCHRKSGGKILQVRRCHRTSGGKILQVKRCHPNTAGGSKAPSQNCRRSMQFGLGTPRMPMRGKLRYSFRCTLILSWVLVVWNKYSILPQRDSRTSLVLVQFCRRNCPAGPASSFGPLWTLRKGRRSGVGDCPGVLSNTVDLACSLGISSPRCFACSVGFF